MYAFKVSFARGLMASTAAIIVLVSSDVFAADLPPASPAPIATSDSWTGLYAGLFMGAGGIVNDIDVPGFGSANGVGGEGVFGGVMAGYNFQIAPRFVIGLEGDIAITDLTTDASVGGFGSLDAKPDWMASLSGRLGWLPSADTMMYVIGGYSFADYDLSISGLGGIDQEYHGFHVGTGMESRVGNNLTARVEYRYTQFGDEDWGSGGLVDVEPSAHTGRVALAWNFYNFGNDGVAPAPGYAPDSWTGFYAGLYGGAGAIVDEITIPGFGNANGVGGEGLLGGVMAGYDHQFAPRWVAGLQGEVGLTDLTTDVNVPGLFNLDAQPEWTADVSLRLGWLPVPETMLYVLGGYSYADYDVSISGLGSFSQDYHGFHAGTGMETYLSKNLTARVEYRYTQYDEEDWGTGGFVEVEPSSHTGRIGLAWKFGGFY